MIESTIRNINVEYGKGKAELISAHIMTKCEETEKIVVANVIPKLKKIDQQ